MSDETVVERLDELPPTCPGCGRRNDRSSPGNFGGGGYGWHAYRYTPNAPELGCGHCGHAVAVTERVLGLVRAEARAALPKAADAKITRRNKTHKARR